MLLQILTSFWLRETVWRLFCKMTIKTSKSLTPIEHTGLTEIPLQLAQNCSSSQISKGKVTLKYSICITQIPKISKS